MAYRFNILLGRITKISGYEGAVTVKLEKIFSENIPHLESVFLEIEGRPVPFFVSEYEYSGADILKLKFEDYESIEKVTEFTGCRVFLTSSDESIEPENEIQNLNGFNVFDQDNQLLGEIREILSNPGQLLLRITSPQNKEILIPFHEHLILSISRNKKIIVMNIPEGLADIN
jgi:16S rRNA processing protein RimM